MKSWSARLLGYSARLLLLGYKSMHVSKKPGTVKCICVEEGFQAIRVFTRSHVRKQSTQPSRLIGHSFVPTQTSKPEVWITSNMRTVHIHKWSDSLSKTLMAVQSLCGVTVIMTCPLSLLVT